MKRVMSAALLGMIAAAAPARADEIVVGITATARPFFIDGGKGEMSGFNVDLTRLVCERMKITCRLETASFPQVLSGTEQGTLHMGLANVLKTPEREQKMLFSAPIWRSTSSFIAAADVKSDDPYKTALSGRLCVIAKSAQQKWAAAEGATPERLIAQPTLRAVFDGLSQRNCDAALMPTVNALDFLSSEAGQGFDYFGPPLDRPGLAGDVHIVISKGRPELRDALDQALSEIGRDGSYRKLIQRYFPFDIL